MIPKFKKGDKCKVIKNLLSPTSIGDIIEIVNPIEDNNGKIYYTIIHSEYPSIKGLASENCLEKV